MSSDSTRNGIDRRTFITSTALTAGSLAAGALNPRLVRAASANEQVHVGMIGAGGRGAANLRSVRNGCRIVALCDVNSRNLDAAAENHPDARTYADYRKMLEAKRDLDAVVISIPDHSHALPTLMALDLDLHVYCEKPLTHTIDEARKVRRAAAAKPHLATQMGIQIHAGSNYRRVVELIQSGAIGPVREAHVWVSRAWGGGGRPEGSETPPDHLDWNLWLGGAPERPYHSAYMQRPGWYKFWDFAGGTGTDLGSHWNDLPFWALKLDAPQRIESEGPDVHPETAPATMTAHYHFGARDDMPPVDLYWTQGSNHPPRYEGPALPEGWNSGAVFVGDKGRLLSDYGRHLLLPEEDFAGFEPPEPWIPDSPGHHAEWLLACRGEGETSANFDYAGRLTEMNHLGNIAYRTGQPIEWEPESMRLSGADDAEALLQRDYRDGFAVD